MKPGEIEHLQNKYALNDAIKEHNEKETTGQTMYEQLQEKIAMRGGDIEYL